MNGAERIAAERCRQQEREGFTVEADVAQYRNEALRFAALSYLTSNLTWAPPTWPWSQEWWKPSDDPIRNLEKAGALIAAEIDRLLAERDGSPTPPELQHDCFSGWIHKSDRGFYGQEPCGHPCIVCRPDLVPSAPTEAQP